MRRAGVVGHQVHRHLDAPCVRRLDQPVQRRHPAEERVDVARVGDVVAVVGHRRHHHRVQPDRVDAQRLEVVQPGGDAVEVTDAVAVAVAERARIHLVEHRVRPPRPGVRIGHARNLHRAVSIRTASSPSNGRPSPGRPAAPCGARRRGSASRSTPPRCACTAARRRAR